MRVIAGTFRSRLLKGSPPPGVRPTSDRLRETLFNILGPTVEGAIFLDAFAGVGGVGIEAISRGAKEVCFVEQSRKAVFIIRENLKSLDISRGYRLMETDIMRALDACERENIQFDIAFLDPPYEREDLYAGILRAFDTRPLLRKDGVVIAEHSKRFDLPENSGGLGRYRKLVQGDSRLSFYRIEAS